MALEKETEEKIFKAAQTVFQKRGFDGARMQEIADEAEINKSMLHYYYRSKDKLFQEVFQAGVKKVMPQLFGIISSELSLQEKVEKVVNFYHDMFWENQHLPSFVTYEMNQHPERFQEFMSNMNIKIPDVFADQIRKEVEAGRMADIPPRQFLMNIVGMSMMPMVAKKMVQTIFSLDEEGYFEFLEERRKLIPILIFKGVQPS
ncbi:TetR/AcrR family transcriptional regulator [Gracilimonas mengyeensis]|uniref:Transcriptional regulator, TetR family n=1 Tax=Gracilimonas mengyeensis TaxID=1302730 RepID=A0A521EC18_9BACT|nr:TetR/AcrR family transcriptional regulator [Gracilimonas mengyeensis]SMO81455.1 transcriptional regulator, TetR family [Gracilimonas mengyeensis]